MSQFEKLEKMGKAVLKELTRVAVNRNRDWVIPSVDSTTYSMLYVFNTLARKLLPDFEPFLATAWAHWSQGELKIPDAESMVKHTLEQLEWEKDAQEKIGAGKLFDSAHDKLEVATKIFQEGDEKKYPSVLDYSNSALELMLKDKLEIPVTLTNVNTAKIIEILVSDDVGPTLFLLEAQRHISSIDNRTKHEGYNPTKVDCIKALKAAIGLETQLKNRDIQLSEEVRDKIYGGIQFNSSKRLNPKS